MSALVAVGTLLNTDQARDITDQIKGHTEAVWNLLLLAHEGKAWKALGYDTWAEYVGGEFNLARSRSYQILDQALVIRELETVLSTKVDISEREARDLKPVLAEVIEEVAEQVAELGDEPEPEDVQSVVDDVIAAHRPAVKITDTHKEEMWVEPETGEILDAEPEPKPALLPPAPKLSKSAKLMNAEQTAAAFGQSIQTIFRAESPEGRKVILEAWAAGFEACSPVIREYVNPTNFRAIARGLNALANSWETK